MLSLSWCDFVICIAIFLDELLRQATNSPQTQKSVLSSSTLRQAQGDLGFHYWFQYHEWNATIWSKWKSQTL